MLSDLRQSMRSIRAELQREEPPGDGAETSEHVRFIWHQVLAAMLSPWYWLVVVLVAAVAAVIQVAE